MDNTNAIAVMNDYPPDKFNLLIPVKTMQEISPMNKVVINLVQIDPNPEKGDVYKEKNGDLAHSKKGLAKLMAAANIQIIESKPVTPQRCCRCADIAVRTRMAPKCGDCPNGDDVAYQVTLAVPEPSGTWRMVRATKEIRMVDEEKKMTAKQYEQFYPYRSEQCETKALNRALREALMIKSTYKVQELVKPFAVAYVVPNLNDPEIKKAVAAKYANSMTSLFGGSQSPQMIESGDESQGNMTVVGPDDEPRNIEPQIIPVEEPSGEESLPPWEQGEDPHEDVVTCEGCAEIITSTGNWTVEMIAEYSKKTYGEILCPKCQKGRKRTGAAK